MVYNVGQNKKGQVFVLPLSRKGVFLTFVNWEIFASIFFWNLLLYNYGYVL